MKNKSWEKKTKIIEISIDAIVADESRHARVKIDEWIILELAEALDKGTSIPPIEVYSCGEKYLLADGFHRFEAYRVEKRDVIPAVVYQGGRKEALLHALGANADHGLRRTNADKKKAVIIALTDPVLQGLSDNEISKICKVSQPFVGKIRKELTYNGYKFPTLRECANGAKMNTANIGSAGGRESASTDQVPPKVEDGAAVPNPLGEENPDAAENKNQASEENIDTNNEDNGLGGETQGSGGTTTGAGSRRNDQDLNLEETDEAGNIGSGEEEQVSGDAPPETESRHSDQGRSQEGSGYDDFDGDNHVGNDQPNGELGMTNTDTGIEYGELEEGVGDNGQELSDLDDTGPTDLDNENGELGEGARDNDNESSDLDGTGPDPLKLHVIHLQGIIKKQSEEIEKKNCYIADLEHQVEELKDDNEYLRNELQASIKVGNAASAFLDTHSMDNNHVSFGA